MKKIYSNKIAKRKITSDNVASFFGSNGANEKYSQTSRKRPPQMQRFSGRLRDEVTYENWTTRSPFLEEVSTIYMLEDNSLHTITKLRYV